MSLRVSGVVVVVVVLVDVLADVDNEVFADDS